jgi:hypothetical protein
MGGGAIACTCGALDVGFSQMVRGLLRIAGIQGVQQTHPLVKEIIISAGNELTVNGGRQTISPVEPAELVKRLAWAGMYQKDGWLAFRGQSLESVVAELNRHNRRKLRIGDPQTARLRVGGKFRVTDLDGFVAALGLTHGVRATLLGAEGPDSNGRTGEVITLSGGNAAGGDLESRGPADLEPPAPEH